MTALNGFKLVKNALTGHVLVLGMSQEVPVGLSVVYTEIFLADRAVQRTEFGTMPASTFNASFQDELLLAARGIL